MSHVEYSSKDDKLNDTDFRQMFEQEFEAILEENPLLDSFELTLSADSADPDKLETFIAQIAELDGVDRVSIRHRPSSGCMPRSRRSGWCCYSSAEPARHLAHPAEQHDPAGDLLETLPD